MIKKIGFLGIGLMGLPMSKNILKAGYNLKVFNRSQNKTEPLKEFGAKINTSISDVVKESDVVITMLTDDTAIDDVMNSSDFLDNLKSGATVIYMSSVKPTTAIKHGNYLKSKNINYLDAPVSGGTIGAEEASLAIMVGGEQKVFDKVTDILKAMGNPTLVGPSSSGQVSKLANQIIVGLTELISITVAPDFKLSKKLGLSITSLIAISSVSIVITTSLSFTTSFIEVVISAPNSFKNSAFFCDLLNTFKLYPPFNIFFAIGRPIKPMPIKAIFLLIYFFGVNSWKF